MSDQPKGHITHLIAATYYARHVARSDIHVRHALEELVEKEAETYGLNLSQVEKLFDDATFANEVALGRDALHALLHVYGANMQAGIEGTSWAKYTTEEAVAVALTDKIVQDALEEYSSIHEPNV